MYSTQSWAPPNVSCETFGEGGSRSHKQKQTQSIRQGDGISRETAFEPHETRTPDLQNKNPFRYQHRRSTPSLYQATEPMKA